MSIIKPTFESWLIYESKLATGLDYRFTHLFLSITQFSLEGFLISFVNDGLLQDCPINNRVMQGFPSSLLRSMIAKKLKCSFYSFVVLKSVETYRDIQDEENYRKQESHDTILPGLGSKPRQLVDG
ncbi:hypothetical protein OUZ56_022484 [Daphnia magna]|uniref:Uncharacterized protein n=1 Tax=Daphnia magna TaxID=35525 RepID=A0ABR0AWL0_9CRUS|nr:hypothetical protein OUZ56_022484 [Daphnia magna]